MDKYWHFIGWDRFVNQIILPRGDFMDILAVVMEKGRQQRKKVLT